LCEVGIAGSKPDFVFVEAIKIPEVEHHVVLDKEVSFVVGITCESICDNPREEVALACGNEVNFGEEGFCNGG